jgi:hypothetical protein
MLPIKFGLFTRFRSKINPASQNAVRYGALSQVNSKRFIECSAAQCSNALYANATFAAKGPFCSASRANGTFAVKGLIRGRSNLASLAAAKRVSVVGSAKKRSISEAPQLLWP